MLRIDLGNETIDAKPRQAVVLGDRTVIFIGSGQSGLLSYDSSGHRRWHLVATTNGAGRYKNFTSLLHAGGDRSQVHLWDALSSRLTTIDAHNNPIEQRQIDHLPMLPLEHGGRINQSLQLVGRFADGELLATVIMNVYQYQGVYPESTTVYRVSERGKLTAIGRVLESEQYLYGGGKYAVMGRVPFGRSGRIAVSGSRWFYTDGDRFEIERYSKTGGHGTFIRSPRSRVPLGKEQIDRYMRRALHRAEPRMQPDLSKALAWVAYSDSMPAYANLQSDHAGMIWARVFTPQWEPARWDLFDRQGRQLGEVQLPAELRVLDITRDALLGYRDVPGRDAELLVYRLERTSEHE